MKILMLTLCLLAIPAHAGPVEDLRAALPTAIATTRAHRDLRFEASGQMDESYERALKTLENVRTVRALREDLLVQARAAGLEGDLAEIIRTLAKEMGEDERREFYTMTATISQVGPGDGLDRENAERVIEQVELIGQAAAFMRPTMRIGLAAELGPLLEVALDFAPTDAEIRNKVASHRAEVAAVAAQLVQSSRDELAAQRWPGGDRSSAVAVAGAAFLKRHGEWGGDTSSPTRILRVASHGQWFVASRDLFGRPTAYAHPVWVAVQEPSTPDDVVHVLNLSLVTAGPSRDTNFADVWVGAGLTQMLESKL